MTLNGKRKSVEWWFRNERNGEAVTVEERTDDVAHDVDLRRLVPLDLVPDDWIVEKVEFKRVEAALDHDRSSAVHEHHLTT